MTMRALKHLSQDEWPDGDAALFDSAYAPGDIFDDPRAGTHLSTATRKNLHYGWARWLAFLAEHHPGELYLEAADRIRPVRVRA